MRADRPPLTFEEYAEGRANYFASIQEAGDLAWFQVGHERRDAVVATLGLPADIPETELRRALWERRYDNRSNAA